MSSILIPQNGFSYPRFGWRNIIEDVPPANYTSSFEDQKLRVAFDARLYEKWAPSTNAIHYLQTQSASAADCDYVAFFSRDLKSQGVQVRFQRSPDGVTWTTIVDWFVPEDGAVMKCFEVQSSPYYRLQFDMTTNLASVNDVKFGLVTMVESGLPVGSTTPKKARMVKTQDNISNEGNFLGRSVTYVGWEMEATYEYLSESFMQDHWLPMIQYAERKPLYWAWNYEDSPTEVEYCWTSKTIPNAVTQTPIHWRVRLPLKGVLVE